MPSVYSSETVVCYKCLNTSVRALSRGLTLGNLRGYWVTPATARIQSVDIYCLAKVPTPVYWLRQRSVVVSRRWWATHWFIVTFGGTILRSSSNLYARIVC